MKARLLATFDYDAQHPEQPTADGTIVVPQGSFSALGRRFVIDYDLVAQSRVLSSVGKGLSRIGDRLRGKQGAATAFQWALPAGIAAVLLAAGAFYAARRKRRAGTHGRTLSGDEARARSLWLAARHRLERSHVAVAPSAGVVQVTDSV